MNLQQLHYVVEIVRHGNHLSAAAAALSMSQPGVSQQIQLLEQELGLEIFSRTRNRINGLTEAGTIVHSIAQRIAVNLGELKTLKDHIAGGDRGTLTIATTHTPARYLLPHVVRRFLARYPDVRLILRQGNTEQVCAQVEAGEADLAVSTQAGGSFPNLLRLRCRDLTFCVVAPPTHPILSVPELTLEEIVRYPLIAYDGHNKGLKVWKAFAAAGLEPNIAMSGMDADLCKTYVRMGLGIGILAGLSFDAERDQGIEARDASMVLPTSEIGVALRPGTYLHPYLLDFLGSVAPHLTPDVVRRAIRDFDLDHDIAPSPAI